MGRGGIRACHETLYGPPAPVRRSSKQQPECSLNLDLPHVGMGSTLHHHPKLHGDWCHAPTNTPCAACWSNVRSMHSHGSNLRCGASGPCSWQQMLSIGVLFVVFSNICSARSWKVIYYQAPLQLSTTRGRYYAAAMAFHASMLLASQSKQI